MFDKLSSTKPFMFNAYYEWMIKNEITPHLLVDASVKGVKVPLDFVKDDCIILSLKPTAISEFQCLERGISFKARFKGVSEDIYIPYKAMEELIAIETNCSLPIGKALEQLELSPQADEEIYQEFVYYMEHQDFACKVKVGGYTVVDVLIWQIDHFRAWLDRDTTGTKQNKDRMVLLAFDTLLKMRKDPSGYLQKMQGETGTDFQIK